MNNELPKTIESEGQKMAYELFDLDENQKIELKKRVEESKGLIRIFVHPIGESKSGEPIENQDRVLKIFVRTISSEKSPPVIVLENFRAIDGWKESFKKTEPNSFQLSKDIYLVPTIFDYPYPAIPGKPVPKKRDENGEIKDEDLDYVEEGFKNFVEYLNDLGVKKVLVGGVNLSIEDDQLSQCVGNFIQLMKGMSYKEIKLSLGTAPLNRTDIRNSHPDLL